MLSRSLKRKVKRIAVFGFLLYCLKILFNSITRSAPGTYSYTFHFKNSFFPIFHTLMILGLDSSLVAAERLIPGPENLCPDAGGDDVHPYHLFFLDMSGEDDCLTARQACSVESAGRSNPNAIITIHRQIHATFDRNKTVVCPITRRIREHVGQSRMKIVRHELLGHLDETPYWSLFESGYFNQTQESSLLTPSKAIRQAIMWKQGGMYLELGSSIVLRPLHCLRNTMVMSPQKQEVSDNITWFETGQSFLWYMMERMAENQSVTLTKALLEFCERDHLSPGILSCWNSVSMKLESSKAFYPLSDKSPSYIYQSKVNAEDWEALRHSFLIHVNHSAKSNVPPTSMYGQLAKEYCPLTYEMAVKQGGF